MTMLFYYAINLMKTNRYKVLEIILKHLYSPDLVNKNNETLLYHITRNLNQSENRKMAKFLIENGCNFLRKHDITGFTPAVNIVQCEDQDLIDFLLSRLFSINIPIDSVGGTALHHAVRCGNEITVLKLLNKGANPNRENTVGNTSVHEAVLSKGYNLLKCLIHHGGDINRRGISGKRPIHLVAYSQFEEITMSKVLECKPCLKALDNEGNNPLLYYVKNYKFKVKEIEMLLVSGGDPNAYDEKGRNVLHVIAGLRGLSRISDEDLVITLIQHGVNVDAQTVKHKNTALHIAIMSQNGLVSILLANKASLFVKNAEGQTPFDLAIMMCRFDAIMVILPFATLRGISEEELINECDDDNVDRNSMMGFVTVDILQCCQKEIETLKNMNLKIFPSISCYDLLYISDKKFVQLLKNVNFKNSFESTLYEIYFVIEYYYTVLTDRFKLAQRYRYAQDIVIEFLYSLNELPILCIEKIVDNMDGKDLFRLQKQIENSVYENVI